MKISSGMLRGGTFLLILFFVFGVAFGGVLSSSDVSYVYANGDDGSGTGDPSGDGGGGGGDDGTGDSDADDAEAAEAEAAEASVDADSVSSGGAESGTAAQADADDAEAEAEAEAQAQADIAMDDAISVAAQDAEDAEDDNAVASFFSNIIDFVVPSFVTLGVVALTGQTLGQNVTGAASAVSSVVSSVVASVTDSSNSQGTSPSTQGPDTSEVGGGGTGSIGNTFFPVASLAPSIQFFANKEVLAVGEPLTLTWETSNAISCEAQDSWSGVKSLSGSEELVDITESRVYSLLCNDKNESYRTRTLFITVLDGKSGLLPSFSDNPDLEDLVQVELNKGGSFPAPILTLLVEPKSVPYGQSAVVTWNSENAIVCVGGDDWPRSQDQAIATKNYIPVVGQRTLFHVTSNKDLTLSCFSADGQRVEETVVLDVTRTQPTRQ